MFSYYFCNPTSYNLQLRPPHSLVAIFVGIILLLVSVGVLDYLFSILHLYWRDDRKLANGEMGKDLRQRSVASYGWRLNS